MSLGEVPIVRIERFCVFDRFEPKFAAVQDFFDELINLDKECLAADKTIVDAVVRVTGMIFLYGLSDLWLAPW